jgi:EpsI family protein
VADLVRLAPPALLGLGCLLISGIRGQQRLAPRAPLASVAVVAPGYAVTEVEVPEDQRRIAGMSHYVNRSFVRDSADAFYVYVGYYDYQVQGKSIHSPKNCLPGGGWEPLQSGTVPVTAPGLGTVKVNRYLLANQGAQALVYYWYEGRGRVEASEYRVKWDLLRDAALYGRTEEALVRVVVPVDPRRVTAAGRPDYTRADSLATALAAQLVPAVARVVPTAPGA